MRVKATVRPWNTPDRGAVHQGCSSHDLHQLSGSVQYIFAPHPLGGTAAPLESPSSVLHPRVMALVAPPTGVHGWLFSAVHDPELCMQALSFHPLAFVHSSFYGVFHHLPVIICNYNHF